MAAAVWGWTLSKKLSGNFLNHISFKHFHRAGPTSNSRTSQMQNVSGHCNATSQVIKWLTIKNQNMRKVIAAINMTIDGFCDHTAGFLADEELHYHYAGLLNNAEVILYGRTTYQLMQFWQTLLKNPSDEKSMNDFAISIDKIEKIVFSNTLKDTGWNTAKLANRPLDEEVLELKKQSGKDIFVGSRSLIIQLLNSNLIDEFQICIHPVIEGKGSPLFDQIKERTIFNLIKTKSLKSGATVFYYEPTSEKTTNR